MISRNIPAMKVKFHMPSLNTVKLLNVSLDLWMVTVLGRWYHYQYSKVEL